MNDHSLHYPDAGRQAHQAGRKSSYAALAVVLLAMPLGACSDRTAPLDRAAFVRTEIVQPRDGQASVTLTGEVQARFRADLSFRVSGRVITRLVDVGAHVNSGDVLARIDSAEQQAVRIGAADGNRTHVCALVTHGSAIELRTLVHRAGLEPAEPEGT